MKTSKLFAGILISLLWIPTSIYAENILTIERAVQLALEKDFLTKSYMQQSKAFEEYSVAADTWMDPKIKLGILSLPTDSLELDQEPMTQLIVGYQQNMPRGDINEYQSEHLKARSDEKKRMLNYVSEWWRKMSARHG